MNVCILKILYFDRIDVTERGKVNKKNWIKTVWYFSILLLFK